jgi:hypothetical protein
MHNSSVLVMGGLLQQKTWFNSYQLKTTRRGISEHVITNTRQLRCEKNIAWFDESRFLLRPADGKVRTPWVNGPILPSVNSTGILGPLIPIKQCLNATPCRIHAPKNSSYIMALEEMDTVSRSPNQLYYCVYFFKLFVTYFVDNVSATVSYDQKELLDIRAAITHLVMEEDFFFNESDSKYLLQTPDKAQIPVIRMRKTRRSGCLVKIRRRVGNLPQPSVLLANVQSLDNKIDKLRSQVSHGKLYTTLFTKRVYLYSS